MKINQLSYCLIGTIIGTKKTSKLALSADIVFYILKYSNNSLVSFNMLSANPIIVHKLCG